MSNNPYVLLLVTIGNGKCGPCNNFKSSVLPDLEMKLRQKGIILVHVEVPDLNQGSFDRTINANPRLSYLKSLNPRGFPYIARIPTDSYEAAVKGSGVILTQEYINKPRTSDDIFNWIQGKGEIIPK